MASSDQVDAVLECYRQAARANQQTPGRQGNVVVLGPELGDDCLVSGDLHGHTANFEAILRLADLDAHPRRHLVLQEVCHGGPTFPGGGCRSFELLERVAELKVRYPGQVHFLLSNHELAELTDYPILKAKRMLNLAFRMGLQETYGEDADRVREAYCEFIRTCPLAVRLEGGVFACRQRTRNNSTAAHSTAPVFDHPYQPGRSAGAMATSFSALVWGRDHRPDNAHAFAAVVGATVLIHGHEPCPQGLLVPNDTQIILDCCGPEALLLRAAAHLRAAEPGRRRVARHAAPTPGSSRSTRTGQPPCRLPGA